MEFYVVVECQGEEYKPVSGLYASLVHAVEHALTDDHRGRRCYVLALSGNVVQVERDDVPPAKEKKRASSP